MARPGYTEARKARDREFYLVHELEKKLEAVPTLADSRGRPYSDEMKEIHRRDIEPALEAHRRSLAIAEAAFALFAKLPAPKASSQRYFDAVISLQLSVTKDMLDSITKECESKGIRRVELIRNALQMYFDSQADG